MSIETQLEALRNPAVLEDEVANIIEQLVARGRTALPDILRSIETGHYDSERWNTLGLSFLFSGKNEEAQAVFAKLLEHDPQATRGRHLNNLGIVSLRLGNLDAAIKFFSQAFCHDNQFSHETVYSLPAWGNLVATIRMSGLKVPISLKKLEMRGDQAVIHEPVGYTLIKDFLLTGFVAGLFVFFVTEGEHWVVDVWMFMSRSCFDIIMVLFTAILFIVIVSYLRTRQR